jgi:threonine dehydratase
MITRDEIRATYERIAPYVRATPIVRLRGEDFGLGAFEIVLKLESLQRAGAFKARGAFANLLMRDVPEAGVVAASGGNHGVAVAFASRTLGIRARIYIPTVANPAKIARIREYGADLVVGGDRYADALAASEEFLRSSGAMRVHAFDHEKTIAGQGTVALELESQASDISTVLVPVGGGGLISGIASWFAGTKVRVIGVEPEGAPTLTKALEAGKPVDAPAGSVAADSLAPSRVGEMVFPIARQHVDRVLLVSDDDIVAAQDALWSSSRLIAEPGGATAFAALLARKYQPADGEHVALLVSGANTNAFH